MKSRLIASIIISLLLSLIDIEKAAIVAAYELGDAIPDSLAAKKWVGTGLNEKKDLSGCYSSSWAKRLKKTGNQYYVTRIAGFRVL